MAARPEGLNRLTWPSPVLGFYAAGVEPTGWWQRVVRFFRWKPSTHRQVWLYAVFGIGVPAFVIWSVIGIDPKPYAAIIYAASITLFGGLARSKKLNRRRREGR